MKHNRLFGAIYGDEHIAERENARALLIELNRRREVLYTPEVIHMDFESMVRNFIDLAEDGIRRILRATRKGIRRESLSEYALLPRDDGSPAWVCPNSFDMLSDTGFWQAEFILRFGSKFEYGLINSALKTVMSPPPSTAGETVQTAPRVRGWIFAVPDSRPSELRRNETSPTHAPIKDDTRICWGRSSWRSCPRGTACPLLHFMVPTKKLHWLSRGQARGHRSQMGIPPDSSPGYIAALRETNSAGDGKDKSKPVQIWKPKSAAPTHVHTDGEVLVRKTNTNPAAGDIPADFGDIVYAALENKLEQLVHSTDDCAAINTPEQLIQWKDRSLLPDRKTSLESCWGQAQPRISTFIEPWVMQYMVNSSLSFPTELLKAALTSLSVKGSSKQRLLAWEGLAYLDQVKGGHQKETQSYWWEVLRRGDFASQELSIACPHSHVIDLGESIPIQDALMRGTGNVENVGRNQCVILHLAAGMLWNESGWANAPRAAVGSSRRYKN